jgi:prepilin-type N-terminal cleavage/methylation domain-containing protein
MRALHQRPSRGFTLVELVIAMGASAIVVAAAMTLMISQQTAYRAGTEDRALQEASRIALAGVVVPLRKAGYGVDPAYALDFGQTDAVPQPGLQGGQTLGALSSYRCDTAIDCRDRTASPDEIVFYSRDPLFSRRAKAGTVTTSGLTLVGRMEQPLRAGQVLQVMCLTGEQTRAYVTVSTTVPAASNVPENDTTDVPVVLTSGQTIDDHPAFPFQNDQLTSSCFGDVVIVAKVDRYRLHIMGFREDGSAVDPAAGENLQETGVRPYLMLDQGLRDADGGTIDVPVAPDVEDLQFTYLYPPAVAGGSLREVGGAEGILASAGAFPMALVQPPAITDALTAASRASGSPANIQAIRVSLVVRTPDADLKYEGDVHRRIPPTPASGRAATDNDPLANRSSYRGIPDYRRMRVDTTILVPNMRASAVTYCVTDPTGATAGANYGGC